VRQPLDRTCSGVTFASVAAAEHAQELGLKRSARVNIAPSQTMASKTFSLTSILSIKCHPLSP
jgi:hypothetical protein